MPKLGIGGTEGWLLFVILAMGGGLGLFQGLRMKFCVGLARGSSAIQPGA